jgi:hypothetical protein
MNAPQPMGALFDQYEAELLAKDKATTPEQRAAESQRRQAQRDHEAKHTATETEADRANTDEYPTEDDTE